MIQKRIVCLGLIILFFFNGNSFAQLLYYNTWDIIHNTKYIRKNQKVHSIQSVKTDKDKLIISFIASPDRKSKRKPWHIIVNLDSVLSHYEDEDKGSFYYKFDSVDAIKYHVKSIERRYKNISGQTYARGIDINCFKEILTPGFYNADLPSDNIESVKIINDQESELFEVDYPSRIYLTGKHIVLLYNFLYPKNVNGKNIDYVVINIENSPGIQKLNYLKLPFVAIWDTITLPIVLMLSTMQK